MSNESADIIRMLNAMVLPGDNAGKETKGAVDLCPGHLRSDIEAVNAWSFDLLNNAVYR